MNPRTEKVYASQRKKMIDACREHTAGIFDCDTMPINEQFDCIFNHPEGMGYLDEFLEKIENPNTRKNYYANVVSHLRGSNQPPEILNKYREKMLELCSTMNEINKTQAKSDKQNEQWKTLKELQKTIKLQKQLLEAKSNPTWGDIQPFFVSSLYLADAKNPPIRNEYGDMYVVKASHNIHNEDKSRNYLVITGRNKKEFILNDYKTAKTHGQKSFRVGPKLNKIINSVLPKHPFSNTDGTETPLLYNSVGGILGRNGLTKYLTKQLGLSTAMLRHIYISEKVEMPLYKEKQDLAEKMCHSVQLQELYKKENVSE